MSGQGSLRCSRWFQCQNKSTRRGATNTATKSLSAEIVANAAQRRIRGGILYVLFILEDAINTHDLGETTTKWHQTQSLTDGTDWCRRNGKGF